MSRIRIALASMLLLGFTAFCLAQNIGQPSRPLNQEEPRQPQAAPAPQQPEATSQKPGEEKPPQEANPRSQEKKPGDKEKQEQPKAEHPKVGHEEDSHPAQQGHARPAGKSAHIPDPKFKANFGRQHTFTVNRVITQTTIVPNQTQFVLQGFTFIFLDPWPAGWLFTDDCFIDFIDDEYFLIDVFHPGVRVALFVVG